MAKPLEDERFRKLQRDAEVALESRPDLSAAAQRDLEAAIEELNAVVLKLRTQPARAGDPQKGPEVALAQQQIGVLEMWRQGIVNRRPAEALRERIEAAKRFSQTSPSTLHHVRDQAIQEDIVALQKLLAEVNDPQQPDTKWVNRAATRAFIQQEMAEMRAMIDAIE